MAEVRFPAKAEYVQMECDKCKKGLMMPTGTEIKRGGMIQVEHACDRCKGVKMFAGTYPKIDFNPVLPPEEVEDTGEGEQSTPEVQ